MSGASSPVEETRSAGTVQVVVPRDTRYASTVRLVAASLGADVGFDVDEIDDLRLGVSEVFALLVDGHLDDAGSLRVEFTPSAGAVVVEMSSSSAPAGPLELDMISRNILDTALDRFEERADGTVVLEKRRAPS